MRSRIEYPDRLQRLIFGFALMALNLVGIAQSPDWMKWAALVLQIELITTGLIGRCPIMWACRRKQNTP